MKICTSILAKRKVAALIHAVTAVVHTMVYMGICWIFGAEIADCRMTVILFALAMLTAYSVSHWAGETGKLAYIVLHTIVYILALVFSFPGETIWSIYLAMLVLSISGILLTVGSTFLVVYIVGDV